MGYREALKRGMGYKESEINEACVNILTETDEYPLSFIEFETRDFLGIKTTREDFTEGFVVLNKKYIVSISIVYQNDIIIQTDEEENVSYG
ncbi:MAG: hypothetical protein J6B87_07445 [Clostridia bacterium]|nr:hypothetical protein [Clostridia bacterium]